VILGFVWTCNSEIVFITDHGVELFQVQLSPKTNRDKERKGGRDWVGRVMLTDSKRWLTFTFRLFL
jgi:hypothetical protein